MSDPKRLDEALAVYAGPLMEFYDLSDMEKQHFRDLVDAARAYRDLLANGQRVEWCEEHGEHSHGKRFCAVGIDPESRTCRIVSKLLIDPTTEEEPIDSDPVVSVEFDPMGGLNPTTEEE